HRRREVAVDLAIHRHDLGLEILPEHADDLTAATQLVLIDVRPIEAELLHHPDQLVRQHHSHSATSTEDSTSRERLLAMGRTTRTTAGRSISPVMSDFDDVGP